MLVLGRGAQAARRGGDPGARARARRKRREVREDWNGFNVLHTAASRVGGLDLGFVPGPQGRDVAGMLAGCESGAIECLSPRCRRDRHAPLRPGLRHLSGHHGDAGARRADVVLPGAAYTEKDATYVNTEGRVQLVRARCSRRARRARTGRSCAHCRMRSGKAALRSLGQLRRRMIEAIRSSPRLIERRAPLGAASARRGRSSPRPSPIRSPISTAPIRSAAPRRPWRNAPRPREQASGEAKTGTHG